MFQPLSTLAYHVVGPTRQVLVCSLSSPVEDPERVTRWAQRACALFAFHPEDDLANVVRDLLANPQIRAIVFDGEGEGRKAFEAFWRRETQPEWGINPEHLEMVRQFVDLWDGDFGMRVPYQPFFPERIKYPL